MRDYSETKGERRERKQNKRKHGMRISGKSIFTIQETIINRPKKNKKGK